MASLPPFAAGTRVRFTLWVTRPGRRAHARGLVGRSAPPPLPVALTSLPASVVPSRSGSAAPHTGCVVAHRPAEGATFVDPYGGQGTFHADAHGCRDEP